MDALERLEAAQMSAEPVRVPRNRKDEDGSFIPLEVWVKPLQPGQRTTVLRGCNQYPPPRGLAVGTEVTCVSFECGYWTVLDDGGKEWVVWAQTLQSEEWGREPGGKWYLLPQES